MARINLLPWREKKRQQEKKQFVLMLVLCSAIAVFCVILMNHYYANLIVKQKARNHSLHHEIALYDRQIEEIKNLKKARDILISRSVVLKKLRTTQILVAHLFDELTAVIPAGIYLDKITGELTRVKVSGYAQSTDYVSQLIKNVARNVWFRQPILNEIKSIKVTRKRTRNQFRLTFMLTAPFSDKSSDD